jgi:hypothetical protein
MAWPRRSAALRMKSSLMPVERVEASGGMVHGSGFTVRGSTAKRPRPRAPIRNWGKSRGAALHTEPVQSRFIPHDFVPSRLEGGPRWTKVDLSDPAERLWMTLVHVRGDPFRVHGSWFTVRDSPTRMTGRGAARGTNAERKKNFVYRALNKWRYLRYLRLFKAMTACRRPSSVGLAPQIT